MHPASSSFSFFFNDTATTEIYTLSLHDALPIYGSHPSLRNALFGRVVGGALRRQSPAGNRVVVRALDNVSLTIHHGDQLGIIGHNGAGKSTMLRVFAGIYQPSEGEITIDGRVSPLFS